MKREEKKIAPIEMILISGLIVGVVACVLIIALGSLTAKEGAILSLLLTFLSVAASWGVSRVYSESQHTKEQHKGVSTLLMLNKDDGGINF